MMETLIKLTDAEICNGADPRDHPLFPTQDILRDNMIYLKGYSDGSTVPICRYITTFNSKVICNNKLIDSQGGDIALQLLNKCPECYLYTTE